METMIGTNQGTFVTPVLTVPMRNGNNALQSDLTSVQTVLTVPMRNGNEGSRILLELRSGFLPYL